MLSLHVATTSMQVRRCNHESLRQLLNCFVTNEDLRGRNILLALKLLLCVL